MDNQQVTTEFIPSPEQLVFANEYIKVFGNISEASKAIGNDSRSRYYEWCKQDGFQQWLSKYAKDEILKHWGKWYLIAEKYAEAGSYQHLNMLMQIAKEFMPSIKGEGFETHIHFKTITEAIDNAYNRIASKENLAGADKLEK